LPSPLSQPVPGQLKLSDVGVELLYHLHKASRQCNQSSVAAAIPIVDSASSAGDPGLPQQPARPRTRHLPKVQPVCSPCLHQTLLHCLHRQCAHWHQHCLHGFSHKVRHFLHSRWGPIRAPSSRTSSWSLSSVLPGLSSTHVTVLQTLTSLQCQSTPPSDTLLACYISKIENYLL
jgi:hypothetical protein